MYSCWVFDIYSCEINIQYAKTDWFFSLLQALVLGHLHGGEAHHVQQNVWTEIGSFKDLLGPEINIMGQFLGPETERMCQFLCPETDIKGERYYIVSILRLWKLKLRPKCGKSLSQSQQRDWQSFITGVGL